MSALGCNREPEDFFLEFFPYKSFVLSSLSVVIITLKYDSALSFPKVIEVVEYVAINESLVKESQNRKRMLFCRVSIENIIAMVGKYKVTPDYERASETDRQQ